MSVVIRLQRTGKPKQAHYRVVAIERSRGSTGRPIEVLGSYDPRGETINKKLVVRQDRYEAWRKNGALPSVTVEKLMRQSQKKSAAPASAAAEQAKP
ncbi:MAG: 30S ribosomal protein S16 [Elusimicrobia bacterium]|nr:30S ribosomal protein S16 [Elusimicrobiota bacterium]